MASETGTARAGESGDLKAEVERLRGYWHPFHQGLLELSPDYLRAYLRYQHAPVSAGNLEPKVCEFIYIAVDGAVSHLYATGTRRHIEMALDKGASVQEVLEVIQLTMLAGHGTLETGVPILLEELARAGQAAPPALTGEQERIKQAHIERTGHWPEAGDALFHLAPHFVEAFLAYAAIPHETGALAPKIREFIGIAIHASPVAPQPIPLRRHIRRALELGARAEEIADVLQLASAIAIHTCTLAIPALVDAAP